MRLAAEVLKLDGWTIVYICIPNSPHINVVPIPTRTNHSKQRYPDVVAVRGEVTKLIEVEPRLTLSVAKNIALRFRESGDALSDTKLWNSWVSQVQSLTKISMPKSFESSFDLILCHDLKPYHEVAASYLRLLNISVNGVGSLTTGDYP